MPPPRGPLLNYSSRVAPVKTLGEITARLVKHGARRFETAYDENGEVSGLMFALNIKGHDVAFRLPANSAAVLKVLREQAQQRIIGASYVTPEQANRTAWRIIKDWVEAQTALVETGMVVTEEVFLPYMLAAPDKTLYELMAERQFIALPAPSK